MKFASGLSSLLLLLSAAKTINSQPVISLHGSGTTNPSKCYWHVMEQMNTGTKVPVRMTYRGVGSGTGQLEFIGDGPVPDNDFGSGDIPLSTEDYDSLNGEVYHFPIVLGAISFFHSVPVGDKKLNLDSCLLARIFKREITEWSHQDIMDLNPGMEIAEGFKIGVARRVHGSSSTQSITQYLHESCPDHWPADMVDKEITWPGDTMPCEGSGGMTDCIVGTPGTIGYIDSGHGLSQGLQEIELKNLDGFFVSSGQARESDGILAATVGSGIPDELDQDFSSVQLLNRPGQYTWPIVALSYIYVRKDLSFMEESQSRTLLLAFLEALYSEEYISECESEFGFIAVTGPLREKALQVIADLKISSGGIPWTFETDTMKRVGHDDYVISAKRQSYSEVEQASLMSLVGELEGKVKLLETSNAEKEKTLLAMQQLIDDLALNGDTDAHDHEDEHDHDHDHEFDEQDETQLKAAIVMSAISFVFWMFALVFILAKLVFGI